MKTRFHSIALGILLISSMVLPSAVVASESNGTVSATEKYAWGENMGWINFSPASGGLNITDTAVTGYAWSNASGWINFNPASSTYAQAGVRNTCEGDLTGNAWSARLGWIDMTGIKIDAAGLFNGIAGAAGSSTGRIAFNCSTCAVRTDWRPCANRTSTNPGGGNPGGMTGGGSNVPPSTSVPATNPPTQSTLTGSVRGALRPSCVDVIQDGVIDVLDFNMLLVQWNSVGDGLMADTNSDGTVDILDFNQVMICWSADPGL